jgi:hypothetical protein
MNEKPIYRVIYSDYIRNRDGTYTSIAGTELCVGKTRNLRDANASSFSYDSSYHIAWVERLVDGIWYPCDSSGQLYESRIPAETQDVPFDDDIEEDILE